MENIYGTKASNQILRKQFSRGEFSYALSDLTKALGPMIDLFFIGYYIVHRVYQDIVSFNSIQCRGAYIAIIANGLIISSVAVIYIMFSRHGKNFREKMLLLPDSFGIPDDQRMAVVAKTPEEIRKLSRIAIAFAMENGSDPRKALLIC